MKRIVLCADDYGQAPHISKAIIELVAKKHLTAVSCMVNADNWKKQATWLLPYKHEVDLGLHWNLTEGTALSESYIARYGSPFPSIKLLLIKSFLNQLDEKVLAAELNKQIDMFYSAFGRLPDYVDGHQHIQQFPILRKTLIDVYLTRFNHKPYIRIINPETKWLNFANNYKAWMIKMIGNAHLLHLLRENQIPFNASFEGIYPFGLANKYSTLFDAFVKASKDRGIIMCHPGFKGNDPINSARQKEFHFLNSHSLNTVMTKNGAKLTRLST